MFITKIIEQYDISEIDVNNAFFTTFILTTILKMKLLEHHAGLDEIYSSRYDLFFDTYTLNHQLRLMEDLKDIRCP